MVGLPKWRNHGDGPPAPRRRRSTRPARSVRSRGRVSVPAVAGRPMHRVIQLAIDSQASAALAFRLLLGARSSQLGTFRLPSAIQ